MRYLVLKKLEDVTLKELDVTFIERYYAWMLSDGPVYNAEEVEI
jgi:hypothetical protein